MQEMAISKVKANKDKDVLAALEELAKQLPHLHALSARECKLQKLPQEISALTSLAILNLEHNKLTALPSMAKLDGHLRELHLPQNKFITFPSTLPEMVQLALLDLSSNAIAEIPKELEKMRGLRRLNISKNALTVFSPSICMLPALTSLDLSENRLITVPKQVHLPLSFSATTSSSRQCSPSLPQLLTHSLTHSFLFNSSHSHLFLPSPFARGASVGRQPAGTGDARAAAKRALAHPRRAGRMRGADQPRYIREPNPCPAHGAPFLLT